MKRIEIKKGTEIDATPTVNTIAAQEIRNTDLKLLEVYLFIAKGALKTTQSYDTKAKIHSMLTKAAEALEGIQTLSL